jgi:hypothetical protein
MPIMYEQNSLQMEWCLNCHRNPAENLRPTSEIYNMDWKKPSDLNPVWCAATDVKRGTPTAESVSCTTTDPSQGGNPQLASLRIGPVMNAQSAGAAVPDAPNGIPSLVPASYTRFTSQDALGTFLFKHYNIRPARELANCETCHR